MAKCQPLCCSAEVSNHCNLALVYNARLRYQNYSSVLSLTCVSEEKSVNRWSDLGLYMSPRDSEAVPTQQSHTQWIC